MVTDAQRHALYDELVHSHGREHADTMMDLWPGVGWSDVARRADIDNLSTEMRSEIGSLRSEVGSLRTEFDGKLARLEGRMYAANAALAIAVAGLVIAAAKVL